MDLGKSEDAGVGGARLDTVRVLHKTVVSLRLALEKSREELNSLRRRLNDKPDAYTTAVEILALENHALRRKVLDFQKLNMSDKSLDSDVFEPEEGVNCVEDEHQEVAPARGVSKGDSEESEEVDDIELIFTTDDTKEIGSFQENLVSIAENETWHKHKDDDEGSLRHAHSHSVLVETDISKCGVIDENEAPNSRGVRRNTLAAPPLYRPIGTLTGNRGGQIPEGRPVVKFSDTPPPFDSRPILVERNSAKQECAAQTDITALPGGVHWRSESALAHHRGVPHHFTTLPSKFAPPFGAPPHHRRQSLRLSEKTQEARRVLLSDINFTSMVPELSRSADHLCQENGRLDSRLWYPRALPYMKNCGGGASGLSPSCGWLKWAGCDCSLLRHPHHLHHQSSWECPPGGGSSSTSVIIPQSSTLDMSCGRRHSTRPAADASSYWAPPFSASGYKPTWASVPSSPTHFHRSRSVPFSASYVRSTTPQLQHQQLSSSGRLHHQNRSQEKFVTGFTFKNHTSRSKVKFQDMKLGGWLPPGQSLPDLRLSRHSSSGGGQGDEDSTDSLIDESEDYLRRSIDSILAGSTDPTYVRRSTSEYNSGNCLGPDIGCAKRGQPFLARGPCDLRVDYWVKVIADGGRVVVGRVRYVGPLPGRSPDHPHVGVQLGQPLGDTDGTFADRRFFNCEENCGIFVPFKKVIMAWSV